MADLYRAYRLLNSTYDLGLTEGQIVAAEKMAKMAISKEKGLDVTVEGVDSWEFFLDLNPRKEGGEDAGPLDVEAFRHFLPKGTD
jgi:hypothetical protein